jgi:hypothetical protein
MWALAVLIPSGRLSRAAQFLSGKDASCLRATALSQRQLPGRLMVGALAVFKLSCCVV